MNKEKGISSSVGILIIIVIAIVAFGGVFAYQYFTPKTQPVDQTQQTQNTGNKSPIIEGISIEKPNLVVKGQNLTKVQIYLVPTGTGIDPETMSRIVDAVKQSESNGEQIWTYRYPSDLLVTNIFAKGFDDKGNFVKEVDLPIVGATALADALYGTTTDQTAGWKTYTNTQYGYQIKYPSTWESPFKGWAGGWGAGKSAGGDNYCVVDMMGSLSSLGSNQPEIVDLLGKGYVQTSINVGGVDAIRLTRNPSGAGLTEAVYFSYKNLNFRIGRNRGAGDTIENECINTYNQMLSTFKFTK